MVFGNQQLTYRELNAQANRLAHHLRKLGVGPDKLVGICVERSLEMVIGLLGILKAGGAYVPLDPEYPRERLAFMLEDANVSVLLTQERLVTSLPIDRTPIIQLDADWPAIAAESPFSVGSRAQAHHLAYMIYTSGSTGNPKGVLVEHGALVQHCEECREFYGLTSEDRVLQFASLSFDAATEQILPPLLSGARVVLPEETVLTPRAFQQQLGELGLTVIDLPPSYAHQLAEGWVNSVERVSTHQLRLVIIGGEAISAQTLKLWQQTPLNGVRLLNAYGPTETVITATSFEIPGHDPGQSLEKIPIGRPRGRRKIYLLDPWNRPVPVGVASELCIGGTLLARGYHNRPELTAEKFIADPFAGTVGARLYRTGDLARYLPDGNIEFLGRLDHQVKIRSFRVELGEIEEVLNKHPGVQTSVVVAREDTPGDNRLVAYVVSRNGAISSSELGECLRRKLPGYMVPAAFIPLETLPLTPNGKVDRKALPKLGFEAGVDKSKFLAPSTATQIVLAKIWCEVLGLKQVGIQDNFFELGGHSLLAVSLSFRITSLLRVEVPLRWLLDLPTIEELAKRLESSDGELQAVGVIEKADRQKPLPMSFAQQQMWLLQQMVPEEATYNLPVAWDISGPVDQEKVRRALQSILERHEVLRTSLVHQGESLLQQITPAKDAPLPWKEIDLQAVAPRRKQVALERQMLKEARRPFVLAQAPLWRVVWIKLGGDEHVLAFTFHHCIMDEWSVQLFFQELEGLYASDAQVRRANLPELPIQYADYSVWQRRQLTGTLLQETRNYWRKQLRDLPSTIELPTNLTRPPQLSGRSGFHDFRLIDPVASGFRVLASQEQTTLFTLVLAAFQVWLHRYTGQTDLVVGVPSANRERPELEALLGYFINTLPIRARLDGSHSFIDVIRQVRETILEAFAHAKLPFEQIVQLAVKDRNPGEQPLYQVMLVMSEDELAPLRLGQAQSRLLPMETNTSKNDLTLSIRTGDQSFACRLYYATDRFSSDRAASMARHLTELFRSITENPKKPISQLNLLPEADRQQILVEWNRTERNFPGTKCVHELFEEQAERSPEAVAVVFGNKQLTYRELNAQTNRLAHHLQKLGVGPETLAGICVERSLEMVIGLLGILKAGGAYVPLDPEYPKERLAFMLEDAAVTVLLTQAHLVGTIPASTARMIRLDADRPVIADESATKVESGVTAEHLAYMIYTSGSTGHPKGAMNTHQGIVNRLLWMQDAFQLTPADRVLQKTPFSFDVSVWEFFSPLLIGARLVVARPGGHKDSPYLAQLIAQEKITTMHFVPSMLQVFLEQTGLSASCSSLKRVICSGEALPMELQRRFFSTLGADLHNLYGPTEASVDVTYWACKCNSPLNTVPIGRPIANIQIYILDGQLQPVPVGVAGELYIGGTGLARGYHNRPELTAEKFIADPFSSTAGARLYRTGDLARYLPDGNIQFLGRLDHQVKVRGFRVELGEIEAVLNQQRGVQTSVVVAREDTPGDKRLVAYVVSRNGSISSSELRECLRGKLPDYMIPAVFIRLEALPLTPNGKVDRKALPKPNFEAGVDKAKFVAPSTPTEMALARVWCEVLGLKQVGILDNFFELGGHSLLAVKLITKINQLFEVNVPVPVFFQNPTIKKQATVFDQEDHDKRESRLIRDHELAIPFVTPKPDGSRPPLFFLHGDWTGGGFYCGRLSQQLGEDQPFYAVPPYRSGKQTALTLEEMATHHTAAIQGHTPHGPYLLGGYCVGATVVIEIARQLVEQGETVTHLLLVDPTLLSNQLLRGIWPVVDRVGEILKWDLQEKIYYFDRYGVALDRWLRKSPRSKFTAICHRLGFAKRIGCSQVTTNGEGEGDREILDSLDYAVYILAYRLYKLKPLSVPTTVYFPEEETPTSHWTANRARKIFPIVSFEMIPGNHRTCIVNHSSALADKLKKI